MAKDGLSQLAAAMQNAVDSPMPRPSQQPTGVVDERLMQDVEKVLGFAKELCPVGSDIFDLQTLIEECAAVVRDQIREEVSE